MNEALRQPNVRHFIGFRVFFNSRFYYPVFTLLFLDYGLTLEQFAVLNSVWALAIVLAEIPSGALADLVGRKRLVVFAAALMVCEMAVIALVPLGHSKLVFWAFLLNRILSGLGEASASGADEALAFDSLQERGLENQWPAVLQSLTRIQGVGFFIAMNVGAAVYDPALVSKIANLFSRHGHAVFTQRDVLRWPVWLTLGCAVVALYHTCRMREPQRASPQDVSVRKTVKHTWSTANWIAHAPVVLVLILGGVVIDAVVRVFATISSEYFRVIALPAAIYGLVFSIFSLLNLVLAPVGKRLVETRSAFFNFNVMAALGLAGLVGCSFAWPRWGLVPVFVAMATMPLLGFMLSHYLNLESPSERRATVLSFRGLALNLGYGLASLLYSWLVASAKGRLDLKGHALQDAAFVRTLAWLPVAFAILYFSLLAASRILLSAADRRRLTRKA